MAKINFPSSPTNGQTYNQNGVYYTYDSTFGAWVTSVITSPYDNSYDTQVLFNDNGYANGSYGLTFNKSSNTTYINRVIITTNVSAAQINAGSFLLNGVPFTGGSNTFSTISVSTQNNVTASATNDTLVLAAGDGINITTDAISKTITIKQAATVDYGLIDGAVTTQNDYGSIA